VAKNSTIVKNYQETALEGQCQAACVSKLTTGEKYLTVISAINKATGSSLQILLII